MSSRHCFAFNGSLRRRLTQLAFHHGLGNMSNESEDNSRISREEAFHNARFSGGARKQKPFYRSLSSAFSAYWAAVKSGCLGKDVLEYGCGTGANATQVAPLARSFVGIDISPVAIDQANRNPSRLGLSNVRFLVMDAEKLQFPDGTFDLVFGSAILHHLDLRKSFGSIRRVLRPGGSCVFMEPLGYNPAINLYRLMTPGARTQDEHPLLRRDLALAREHFVSVNMECFALLSIVGVPLRNSGFCKPLIKICNTVDAAVLKLPGIRWLAWTAVLEMRA